MPIIKLIVWSKCKPLSYSLEDDSGKTLLSTDNKKRLMGVLQYYPNHKVVKEIRY